MRLATLILLTLANYAPAEPAINREIETLTLPPVTHEKPASGKRVSLTASVYQNTEVHHTLYLPPHWNPEWKSTQQHYPLIVEFSGNQAPSLGSTGRIEDSALGYGLSAGQAVWLNLPFISPDKQVNQLTWWGNEEATIAYAKKIVPQVIADYGINPDQVILCGFSRGAIAVNYIGLHDDEIASLWSAFVTHDHFDGVREWPGTKWGSPLADYRKEASRRLARLKGRPYLICQNGNTNDIQKIVGDLPKVTYLDLDTPAIFKTFPNPTAIHPHTDRWLLKPSSYRNQAWDWMKKQGFLP